MKAILEFTLPEEAHDHALAVHANELAIVLEEIRTWLRTKRKHGDLDPTAQIVADEAWDVVHALLQEYEISGLFS